MYVFFFRGKGSLKVFIIIFIYILVYVILWLNIMINKIRYGIIFICGIIFNIYKYYKLRMFWLYILIEVLVVLV